MEHKLKDVVYYLLMNSPNRDDMSKAWLTKLVYLADWRSAIKFRRQITDIQWEFTHNGPFVYDVFDLARGDACFRVQNTFNAFGHHKTLISIGDKHYAPNLSQEEREILDHVIRMTCGKTFASFISLVYSTYPIRTVEKYNDLNLVALAEKYQSESSQSG